MKPPPPLVELASWHAKVLADMRQRLGGYIHPLSTIDVDILLNRCGVRFGHAEFASLIAFAIVQLGPIKPTDENGAINSWGLNHIPVPVVLGWLEFYADEMEPLYASDPALRRATDKDER